MFLIIGISQGEKKLDFGQTIVCPACGAYGRIEVYMTYMYFSLFFLPLIKWNKRFYVQTACCNSVCEIDPALGHAIKRGEVTELAPDDLHFACDRQARKQCGNCGYTTDEDFNYCPKCGKEL